jgi:adenine C2-methylase RlmN of 23S rRNA A2503 and tRNA A37
MSTIRRAVVVSSAGVIRRMSDTMGHCRVPLAVSLPSLDANLPSRTVPKTHSLKDVPRNTSH